MTSNAVPVSVVIPAHRAAPFIARAVRSVLAQPGVEVECIVVIDGLVDLTLAELECFSGLVVIVHEQALGAQRSRNAGLRAARHEVVMFLDADDEIAGPLLADAARRLEAEAADICFADCLAVGHRAGWMRLRRTGDPLLLLEDWLAHRFVPPCAVVWRRAFVERIGGWREDLIKNQDGEIIYRALLDRPRITFAAAGHGIYHDALDSSRTSKAISPAIMRNHVHIMRDLRLAARAAGALARLEGAIGRSLYSYRRRAAQHGLRAEYDALTALQVEIGVRKHFGSPLQRLAARLFGLYTIESLKRRGRSALRRMAGAPGDGAVEALAAGEPASGRSRRHPSAEER
jgi:glycosyltransferase involved in cell wall biosynthesis